MLASTIRTPSPDRRTQRLLQVGLGPPEDLGEQPVRHPPASHRRGPEQLLSRPSECLDPGEQHVSQGRRQHHQGIAGTGGRQLLGVERVALRPFKDPLHLIRR
jgi:hypothetical protein